jgi:signal-transduction protein with cAMP-binding, CBS, and nucleotidyltransferase domain
MKEIMNNLEIRFFEKDEIIVNEMDESLEILFVEQGLYEVGFEINNRQFYETQFGMSTIIGAF